MSNSMRGKICMVTGASSGIGKEIALGLAKMDATVILVCRSRDRGMIALDEIRRKCHNDSLDLLIADLSSQKQIRKLVEGYRNKYSSLHVLVNNAGVIMSRRCLTEDGIEMTFAVNYLAYFLLTNLLIDLLVSSQPSRVVNIASMVHKAVNLDFDNLQGEKFYNRDVSYAQSKLADVIFTYELARRLVGTGVTVNCVCPGAVATHLWANPSKIISMLFKMFVKGPAEGARIPIYLASSSEVEDLSCNYFQTAQHLKFFKVNPKNTIAKSSKETYDIGLSGRLWKISQDLTGLHST